MNLMNDRWQEQHREEKGDGKKFSETGEGVLQEPSRRKKTTKKTGLRLHAGDTRWIQSQIFTSPTSKFLGSNSRRPQTAGVVVNFSSRGQLLENIYQLFLFFQLPENRHLTHESTENLELTQ